MAPHKLTTESKEPDFKIYFTRLSLDGDPPHQRESFSRIRTVLGGGQAGVKHMQFPENGQRMAPPPYLQIS